MQRQCREKYAQRELHDISHQKEGVDKDIDSKGWEECARIVVLPQEDLNRNYQGSVEEHHATAKEHACKEAAIECVNLKGKKQNADKGVQSDQ